MSYSTPGEEERHSSRAREGGSARPLSRPMPPSSRRPAPQPAPRTPTKQFPAPEVPPRGPATRSLPRVAREGEWEDPATAPSPQRRHTQRTQRTRLTRKGRLVTIVAALILVALVAWPVGLGLWANSRIQHVEALSGAPDTPGTTTLIAGADIAQGTSQRTDTLMLVHEAPNGKKYLVSIPRDTLVNIPGKGGYKINAAYAFGGAPLLVKTVEQFTGLTVDHFIVIGFDGVTDVVNAVGTVNLCIDQNVDDVKSGLKMTEGCHDVGGEQALAFVRARYFDPTADLGRQKRQQQFVSKLSDRITSPDVLLNPFTHVSLANAGTKALVTDENTGLIDLGFAALTLRGAMQDNANMQMPIENPAFQTKYSGVAILVDDQKIDEFFRSIENGTATPPEK